MQIKKFLFIAILLPVALFSCKKDKDEDNKIVIDDPRIRTMSISALPTTFVVNDVEELIFNYDSLAYGTPIKSLHPVFAGYGGALSFQYKYGENGQWKDYENYGKTTVNFDSTIGAKKLEVFFKSIAPDTAYTKVYKIDIRVHKYDVDAFEWEKVGTLPVQGTVVSQKAVFYNQKYYFYYRNELGKSFVLTSENGENWEDEGEIAIDNPNWATLTSMYQLQTLVVQAGIELYKCDDVSKNPLTFTPINATLSEGDILQVPLFTLGNIFWIIANQAGTNYLYSLVNGSNEFQQGVALSGRVPVENITTFVALSGNTTLGYIFGGEGILRNDTIFGTVWGADVNGNVMELSQNQTVFTHSIYPMPLFFGNKLNIVGGITMGKYTDQFYVSPNSGATWLNDTHKTLPEEIGAIAKGSIFQYERNRVILIGGETKNGFSPNVWKGILKREILDDIINGRQ